MTRQSPFGQPWLLGFDGIEQALARVAKTGGDGYPPYNIERLRAEGDAPERLRIVLAVAGFASEQLDVLLEDGQLVVRGRQAEDGSREFLHRGIAARQFQRTFLLADGLLAIDLVKPEQSRAARRIAIGARG